MLYAGVFIWRSSFVIGGERHFVLFDDAMISMRYARNLAGGNGLVYNIGERVEGFTNPLWTLFMAGVHLLPLAPPRMSLPVQAASAVFLVLTLWLVRRIALALPGGSRRTALAAMVLTALYQPLNYWGFMGMETALQAAIAGFAAWRLIAALETRRFPLEMLAVLAVGTLVRLDMTGLYLVLAGYCWAALPEHRRRTLAWGAGLLVLALGSQTLFRLWYYGDLLPATYYVKMTGYPVFLRITRGLYVFARFLGSMNPVLVLLALAVTVAGITRVSGVLAAAILTQAAYSVYVGGDAWEGWGGANRYLAVAVPLYFILLARALERAVAWTADAARRMTHASTARWIRAGVFPSFVAAAVLAVNLNEGPFALRNMLAATPGDDAALKSLVARAYIVREITDEDATVGVIWAGAFPYFSERRIVDFLGKTDSYVSRLPMHRGDGLERFVHFYPGHLKYDFAYSIDERRPDVIIQFWGDIADMQRRMQGIYVQWAASGLLLHLRADSSRIKWEYITPDGRPPVPPPGIGG